MKQHHLVAIFALCSCSLHAQDILVRRGGEIENVKVLEVSPTEVKYKKSSNPDGPVFVEKRSNLYSVKYQNGEVQTFEENSGKSITTPYFFTVDNNIKKYTHEAELFIADGWGIGYQFRREINQFVGWDIIGMSYMSRFESPEKVGLINIRPLGVKLYTPANKYIRAYAGLKLGYSFAYEENYFYLRYEKDTCEYIDSGSYYDKAHYFGLDFSLGIQLHKNIAIGYNLNFNTNDDGDLLNHMAKISFLF